MTSLTRFKQRLHGELPRKNGVQESTPELKTWVKLVTDEPETEDMTETVIEYTDNDETDIDKFESMTKVELDLYAAENHGIHLDRRKSKLNMITEFIQKLKEKN